MSWYSSFVVIALKGETRNQGRVIYWSVQLQGLVSEHLISSACSFKSSDSTFFVCLFTRRNSVVLIEKEIVVEERQQTFLLFKGTFYSLGKTTSLYKGEPWGQKDYIIYPSLNREFVEEREIYHHGERPENPASLWGPWDIKSTCVRKLILNLDLENVEAICCLLRISAQQSNFKGIWLLDFANMIPIPSSPFVKIYIFFLHSGV